MKLLKNQITFCEFKDSLEEIPDFIWIIQKLNNQKLLQ